MSWSVQMNDCNFAEGLLYRLLLSSSKKDRARTRLTGFHLIQQWGPAQGGDAGWGNMTPEHSLNMRQRYWVQTGYNIALQKPEQGAATHIYTIAWWHLTEWLVTRHLSTEAEGLHLHTGCSSPSSRLSLMTEEKPRHPVRRMEIHWNNRAVLLENLTISPRRI